MGEWFQTIVDVDATAAEAPDLAAATLDWLVQQDIVMATATDCVLAGVGHAPGPNYASIVTTPDPRLHTLRTNGLHVIVQRTVFHSSEPRLVTCPRCTAVTEFGFTGPDEQWEHMSAAIGIWYDGGGDSYTCPTCRQPTGLNELRWDPPWGFGYLGFKFWNWPQLKDTFVAELSRRLGHRTVTPRGKL